MMALVVSYRALDEADSTPGVTMLRQIVAAHDETAVETVLLMGAG